MKIFKNRKASHNFFFVQEFEVGIVLMGTEIKSIRAGKISFKDSYARIEDNEIWLHNLHISPYDKADHFNHDAERKRKLLLNKREIKKITIQVEEKGLTLVPKNLYINDNGLVKITLAVAQGKKLYDKREALQKKDAMRSMERKMKDY
ncbi:MAG: SsrA-binding protein [Candidatus Cloacimonas sp. 4484_143]|nr:MAG: SsrA-binding protein [Candidatus Cloacimonas sp. 4484_143]RLC50568.1 MAG: SsrA-binding protein [Candidatus Cloacimonadota bacterium]RLC54468.1 MAG: SsrA-binding protein [Candidatus Cloacimonadota bacterium]